MPNVRMTSMHKSFCTLAGIALAIGAVMSVAHATPPAPVGRCPSGWDQSRAQSQAERAEDTNQDRFVCVKNENIKDNNLPL
jgi:hypothetical protein